MSRHGAESNLNHNMQHIKKSITGLAYSIFAVGLLLPTFVSAHVKWFAESGASVRPYEITDLPVLLSILVVICMLVVGVYLEKKLSVPRWYSNFIQKTAPTILSIASVGFGLSFLIFSYKGFVFAPNLPAVGEVGTFLIAIQALAGIMIILGFYERIGGLLLILLYMLCVKEYGFNNLMDCFEMLGFAFYAMIIGRPKWRIIESNLISRAMHHFHQYGVSILRVGTGINLLILGFSEKILVPSLTQAFLEKYDWNFMPHVLGLTWFTDYWFAYSAGVAEALFGIFLIFGLVTRITIISLAVFLISTLILLGPIELIGHLPHFSIAAVLLVFGAGSAMHMKKN